jgi:hypothetical protein
MEDPAIEADLRALKLTIDEIKRDQEIQLGHVESMRSTARTVLASGSLIIALISAFQIVVPELGVIPKETYRSLFILGLALYMMMIASCILALWPGRLATPASSAGEDLYRRFEGKSELEARRILLRIYTEAQTENQRPARQIRTWTTIGSVLLPLLVVLFLFLGFNAP